MRCGGGRRGHRRLASLMKNLFISTLVGLLAVVCSARATATDGPVVRAAIQ
jgi:hypothetical protein